MDARWIARQPFWALVDDDLHSARILTRTLLAQGAPAIRWMDGAETGLAEMTEILAGDVALPALVIVDLKSSSQATAEFVRALRRLPDGDMLLVAGMVPSLDRDLRDVVLDAGADAAFLRHAELSAYRQEAANVLSFWARSQQRLAVGT